MVRQAEALQGCQEPCNVDAVIAFFPVQTKQIERKTLPTQRQLNCPKQQMICIICATTSPITHLHFPQAWLQLPQASLNQGCENFVHCLQKRYRPVVLRKRGRSFATILATCQSSGRVAVVQHKFINSRMYANPISVSRTKQMTSFESLSVPGVFLFFSRARTCRNSYALNLPHGSSAVGNSAGRLGRAGSSAVCYCAVS